MHRNGVARLGMRWTICDNARKRGQQNAAREANKRSRLWMTASLWRRHGYSCQMCCCVTHWMTIRQRPALLADHGLTVVHLKAKSGACHQILRRILETLLRTESGL
jgi:hypothetical protein